MADSERPTAPPWADLGLVALLSAAVFSYAHLAALLNPYVINDDVRQQIFWMQRWLDPQLFKGDLLSDYARYYVPWGLQGLYWLASFFVGPLTFSKILPGLLFVFLACCLYRISEVLGGPRRLAWMVVAVFWLMPFFLDNMSGGLARAFAAPLLALFWLCWLAPHPWGMGVTLLLQALFIPYIFLLCAGAAVIAWVVGRLGGGAPVPFPARPLHFLLLALAGGLILLMDHRFTAAGYGPLVSLAEMANRPEFASGGRFAILPVPSFLWELISPWEFIAPFREGGLIVGSLGGAVLLGLAVWGGRRLDWQASKSRWQPVGYLGLASLLLYFLARLFLLKLFVPDRYLIYTLNLFYCLGLAWCWGAALQIQRWPRWLTVLALVLVAGVGGIRLHSVGLYDFSVYRPAYAALAQTPKDALIAGHPNLMDNLMTFGQRRAFATFELSQPWSRGYWQRLKPRLDDLFTAYYTDDPEVVWAFAKKHRVAFLVVDDRHFTPAFLAGGRFFVPFDDLTAQGPRKSLTEKVTCPFFAPFGELIRNRTQDRRQFALLDPQAFPRQAAGDHLWLLDLRPGLSNPPIRPIPPSGEAR